MNLDSLRKRFHARFDLQPDQADTSEIDQTFRSGVEFRGTALWVLIFAIFIASIGLNVNSTAVIIGAMLISPLMGPIMALGYGAGINDSALMRSSLFNLGLATVLSLLASTAYFLITPLSQAHSELLARTTPTRWDVLIGGRHRSDPAHQIQSDSRSGHRHCLDAAPLHGRLWVGSRQFSVLWWCDLPVRHQLRLHRHRNPGDGTVDAPAQYQVARRPFTRQTADHYWCGGSVHFGSKPIPGVQSGSEGMV
jgi:hypothetical protein